MGKKILVPCLDVKMIAFFPRNIQWKIIFLILNTAQGSFYPLQSYSKKTLRKNVLKSARKYTRNVLMPPGHPIILLKSNSFNMAALSVKRSIRKFALSFSRTSFASSSKFHCTRILSTIPTIIRLMNVSLPA